MKITRGGFFKQVFGGVAALVSLARAGNRPAPIPEALTPIEQPFTLCWDGHLIGDELRTGQSIWTGDEFVLRSIGLMHASGPFAFRVWDSTGPLWSRMMRFAPDASVLPLYPEVIIPVGGKIGLDVQDLTGSRNDVCVSFHGVKRYRIA